MPVGVAVDVALIRAHSHRHDLPRSIDAYDAAAVLAARTPHAALSRSGWTEPLQLLNAVLGACVRARDAASALALYREAIGRQTATPDALAVHTVLAACTRSGSEVHLPAAVQVLKQAATFGAADLQGIAMVLGACERRGDGSLALHRLADADFSERPKVDNGDGYTEQGFHERQGPLQEAPPGRVRGGEEEGAGIFAVPNRPAPPRVMTSLARSCDGMSAGGTGVTCAVTNKRDLDGVSLILRTSWAEEDPKHGPTYRPSSARGSLRRCGLPGRHMNTAASGPAAQQDKSGFFPCMSSYGDLTRNSCIADLGTGTLTVCLRASLMASGQKERLAEPLARFVATFKFSTRTRFSTALRAWVYAGERVREISGWAALYVRAVALSCKSSPRPATAPAASLSKCTRVKVFPALATNKRRASIASNRLRASLLSVK